MTIRFAFADERGERVGALRVRTLYFVPGTAPPRRPTTAAAGDAGPATALAPQDIAVTTTMIIAGALASNDTEPIHHDVHLAHRQGVKDIIMSITTTAGLVTRYATGQLSPAHRLRRLALRLGHPAYPGDVLRCSGSVADGAAAHERVLSVCGDTAGGRHVTATLTFAAGASR